MTKNEFIKEAERLNYNKDDIEAVVRDVEALEVENFDYEILPLFEQPEGDI